ncbi:UvrD-helicase domain-containing protein [Pandoraea commovens]|uniref:ATP-dependent DNA helicase Rep n=1 Tax=Pandoraea commovens TaxID=2508289 RepID=A0A5E4TFD1_9BURK|nr:UvrD-helicase domain-containing protein [Pandoraea commovens]UVA79394.1 UvrD-helicase domain-containing protein [Pandoraea commovens]VVD86700.1 ATP-dependent DNA helicase Rep [Pandoraea commovens]
MSSFPLNPAQNEATHYFDGPCLVLAGAGSGKTRVITQKIAWLIEAKGFEPKHIAAVTFTNKAAAEMRERVAKQLEGKTLTTPGKVGRKVPVNQLTICTFHSLGVQILRREAENVGLKPQFSILDADDCFGLIQEQLGTTDKAMIRGVQTAISLWKNGLVTPEVALAAAETADEHQAAVVYRNYMATLQAYQAVDFDDLIRLPAELFERDEEVRERWQNKLRYLLIDEYQDTNTCQYLLLKLLAGPRAAFTAVGDDDQAIYGWRGATLENLKQLQVDFPTLKVIKLEQNYRSTSRILTAANNVIAKNPKIFEKKLWSEHGLGDPITVTAMNDEEHEAESVVFRLSAHKFERRAEFRDYAILYRGNHQARIFEQVLRRERIPYVLSGGQSFFDKAEIKDLCAYLRLLANPDDDPAFIRAVTTPRRGVGSTTLEVLGSFAGQAKVSLFEAVYMGAVEARLQPRQLDPLRAFCDFIQRIAARAARDPANEVIDDLMEGIHYEAYLYDTFDERQAQSRWTTVLEFLEWMKRKGTRSETSATAEGLDSLEDQDDDAKSLMELTQTIALMSMLEGRDGDDPDAVRLSTLHASKGLEYPHVFLVGVEEGILPHIREDEEVTAEKIEEERRLMYVGITRAQRTLQLSWCKKRKRARETYTCEVSRFVPEMQLDEAPPPPPEDAPMSPKDRLASLKAMLAGGANKTPSASGA